MVGVMLLEVVLAIAVFAFGMLALMQLQGNLTRSSADANTRTIATNIAEELVEVLRGYENFPADGANGLVDYMEMFGDELDDPAVSRGGIEYAVDVTIKDFWKDEANDTFVWNYAVDPPSPPAGLEHLANANFKLLKVEVIWNDVDDPDRQEFYIDGDNPAGLAVGGSITIYEVIPSSPNKLGAKIAADLNAPPGTPPVEFTPGYNPEIAALDLGDDKNKESSTPVPDIIRIGELTETYFEVVTYNDANIFLRREEFITVGCECTLNTSADGDAGEGGFRPTLWNGIDYTEGEFVAKSFGESANNQQSVFCDVCCRDHHDGETGDNDTFETQRMVYDPWNNAGNAGQDHPHYKRNNSGVLSEARDNEEYVEACRLIRKDGFFRVAHDFNQLGYFGFAEDYLDNVAEVDEYSAYVAETIGDFYGSPNNQSDLKQPGPSLAARFTDPVSSVRGPYIPASDPSGTVTNLPTPLNSDRQQLMSRGLYPDYMTNEVSARIAACVADADANDCVLPGFTTPLEIHPFFEVQLTSLSNWDETELNMPVDITNEAIQSNNGHSRGRADLQTGGVGPTKADFAVHKGNVGIAAINRIVPNTVENPDPQVPSSTFLNIETTDGIPVEVVAVSISGDIRPAAGVRVGLSDIDISFNEAQCGKTTDGYRCIVPDLATAPTFTVIINRQGGRSYYACSEVLPIINSVDRSTIFSLAIGETSIAHIVIESTPCAAN